ncbi:MAG: peroxide stress protein YaaA [Magnetococcales bacterium]|nr:peroxide stress protein YaaA [Magnetococcales bacterium]
MLILLSPAKKLSLEPVDLPAPATQPDFLDQTAELLKTLRPMSPEQLGTLMKISEKLSRLNYDRFQAVTTPFTPENATPALFTFRGDTYTGLDADTLSDEDLLHARTRLAILSGFYGLLRPFDLMQAYRLEMGTRLKTTRGTNLYAFWGSRVTDAINAATRDHSDRSAINLASNEYVKVVQKRDLDGGMITPTFKEIRDGKARIIGLLAKKARGSMARYAIRNRLETPEPLKEYCEGGYRYREELSSDSEWIFTRES